MVKALVCICATCQSTHACAEWENLGQLFNLSSPLNLQPFLFFLIQPFLTPLPSTTTPLRSATMCVLPCDLCLKLCAEDVAMFQSSHIHLQRAIPSFFKKQEEKAPTDYIKIKKKQNIITESQMAKTNTKGENKRRNKRGWVRSFNPIRHGRKQGRLRSKKK